MITAARYTDDTSIPLNATLDTGVILSMPSYPSDTHYDSQMAEFIDGGGTIIPYPAELPPLDEEAAAPAMSVASQGEDIKISDNNRRAVGATPIIPDADLADFDQWMLDSYAAVDAGGTAPAPPVSVRQAVELPGDTQGQCVISWHEFTGTWAGWGFKAVFQRNDISALGLKVYDENGGYLYALTFVQDTIYPDRFLTETPAGFATPTQVDRSFEIIAGSAPVTPFKTLTSSIDYLSLLVRWQAGDPI